MLHVGQIDQASFRSQRKHISQNRLDVTIKKQYRSLAQRRCVFRTRKQVLCQTKHQQPEQSEDRWRFQLKVCCNSFTKESDSLDGSFSTKIRLSFYFCFISISNMLSEDEGFPFQKITSSLAIFQYNFINICQMCQVLRKTSYHMMPFSIPKAAVIWREFICQDDLAILSKPNSNLIDQTKLIYANQSFNNSLMRRVSSLI